MSVKTERPLLSLDGISKRFGGVHALSGAHFDLRRGEIHALVGENGAGKSTLIRLISGLLAPDEGEIRVEGSPARIDTPVMASGLGIAVVHQDFDMPPNLPLLDSLLLGREPETRFGFVNRRARRALARRLLEQVGLEAPLDILTGALSVAERQLLALARGLSGQARILVMDEPTSALAPDEAGSLLELAKTLKGRGVAVIFVSHKLDEVFAVADRVTVLRDGKNTGTRDIRDTSVAELVSLMVGRSPDKLFQYQPRTPGASLLEARGLGRGDNYRGVSFHLSAGEVLGLYGLKGAGRTALLRGLFGLDPVDSGALRVNGAPLTLRSPADAIRAGIAMVPEDRKAQALFDNLNCRENMSLAALPGLSRRCFVRRDAERAAVTGQVERLRIRLADLEQPVRQLSGGNQQKLVLARWLLTGPRMLLLDEPTAGIDVGAKAELYQVVSDLAAKGCGIIFATSELTELLGVCDRMLVMAEGRLVADFPRHEASEERIMHAIQAGA